MQRRALDQVEEALNLLRRQAAHSWNRYLLGAVPFLLVALWFVRDMTSGYDADRCALESLACAIAFLWMSFWKADFAAALLATLSEQEPQPRNSFSRRLSIQTTLQTLKLLVLPFAAASILPFAWTSGFFRAINTQAARPGRTLRSAIREAASVAAFAPASNWLSLAILAIAAVIVFLNVFSTLILLPQLAKAFTGFETEWTRNAAGLVNRNIFAVAVGVTWLLMDPLYQAYSVVRSFYFEARRDGRDLLLALRKYALRRTAAVVLACAMIASAGAITARAADAGLSQAELDRNIRDALSGHQYAWSHAHAPVPDSALTRMGRDLETAIHRIHSAISSIFDWIESLLRKQQATPPSEQKGPRAPAHMQLLLYLLAAFIILALLFAFFRKRAAAPLALSGFGSGAPGPDLNSADVLGTEMPEEEWRRMANEYAANGQLRLAIRALYLSNLAFLGTHQLIAIAKSKTNRMYEGELRVRTRREALAAAFARINRDYERAWYGMHPVEPDAFVRVQGELQVMRQNG